MEPVADDLPDITPDTDEKAFDPAHRPALDAIEDLGKRARRSERMSLLVNAGMLLFFGVATWALIRQERDRRAKRDG